ncbi:hypothetical protein LT493_25625 [Streptomyces tricolor]|nr:hypothetical protein [Streptomyces tricolor]
MEGLAVSDAEFDAFAAKFDLTFHMGERHHEDGRAAGITGALEFATDLFDRDTARELAARWGGCCGRWWPTRPRPVGEADLLSPPERLRVLLPTGTTPPGRCRGRRCRSCSRLRPPALRTPWPSRTARSR